MSIFREFNISMIPGKPPLIIHVSQYESDFVYTFHLVSGKSVLAIPNSAIAVIRGTKRDGNGFSKEASLDTENNKVVVIGEVQMTACAGRNVFELAIINDEKTICTANFYLDVERAPLDAGTIQSDSVLRELQAIINSAATATQAAEEASASAAEAAESARTLTIDPTLTQSGQAADAKVVGDKITSLKEDLTNAEVIDTDANNLFANTLFAYTIVPYPANIWLIGKILPNGGTDSNFTNVARHNANNIRNAHAGDKITANNGYLIQVVGKKSADYTATDSRWVSSFCKSFVIPEAGYIGVNVMLEDGSDISDANVAGANVNYYRESSVITSIKTDINDLDARADTLEAQGIVVNKNIEAIDLQLNGSEYIGITWVRGVAGTDGTVITSATWGLSCTEILSYSRPVRITVATGYRFFLRYYNSSGTYTTSSAWITTYLDVPANQKFMITVAKYPEDTSHNSNLDWYKNVTIPSLLFSELEAVAPIQWNGKQWYAFGTSLSDTTFPMPYDLGGYTGKYPPYLASLSGLVHTNYAIGGSRISDSATADRNTVYQQLQDTDLTGADLITIDGLVNDWTHNTPIGELDDSTDTTIYGALNLCIDEIAEQNANATIVLITDSTGKRWTTPGGTEHPAHVAYYDKNSLGLYQSDYVEAMKKYAQYVGILCIDAGEISQINALHPQYLGDQIHHSDLGGQQFANAIWSVLKNIQPNVT